MYKSNVKNTKSKRSWKNGVVNKEYSKKVMKD